MATGTVRRLEGAPFVLTSGHAVRVRALEPADLSLVERGVELMSERSLAARFLAARYSREQVALDWLERLDGRDHVAIGAYDPEAEEPIGLARYVRAPAAWERADVAVAVVDGWQRRGVAALLLALLSRHALACGISSFAATARAGDPAARALLTGLGEAMVVRQGWGEAEWRVELS